MLHLLLAFPSGRLETRSHKRLAAASYFVAVGLGLPTLLFADMTDPDLCGCPDNLLMVQDSLTTAQILGAVQIVPAIVLFVLVGRVALRRWRAAEGLERRANAHDLGGDRDARRRRRADRGRGRGPGRSGQIFSSRRSWRCRVPYGFLVGLLRSRTAGLELENVRLDAALRARVEELRASRARIVQASDTARRRLERDLHDGAQQRLVALALDLKLARGNSTPTPSRLPSCSTRASRS